MVVNPLLYRRNLFLFEGTWLIWAAICAAGLHFIYGLPSQEAFLDSLLCNALLATMAFFISNTLAYYNPQSNRFSFTLIGSAALACLWLLATRGILRHLIPEPGYKAFLENSLLIRFIFAFIVNIGFCVGGLLWYHLGEQQEMQERREEADRIAREAELYKLQQQLHPHFLFNSLNSINALIASHPGKARQMVQQLSDFLRSTLKREENEWIRLKEELHNLQLYLDIEKVRFGHRLITETSIAEETLALRLPALLLQPLMENAIKFGLYGTVGAVTIYLRTAIEEGYLVITMVNPYDPDMQMPEGTGFGLKSVKRRLYLLFARNDLIETHKSNNTFAIILKIPIEHDKSNDH